ncbi:MAG: HAMP domain-containing histidine kinase [Oscillospiraceae bacterium]|nr:HAMP domain-containing histidine kinase [Oscillospiraceae bacterium]
MNHKQIERLFSIQRDAAIGVVDGTIVFVNPAGQVRYGDLAPGVPAAGLLPQEVLERDEETFTASVAVREEICTVLGSRAGDLRVYTLIPQTGSRAEDGWLLENVCNSMRRTLTVLNMATELLTPAVERLDEPGQQSNLTAINRSYFQLQRLCDNLDSLVRLSDGQGRLRAENVDLVRFCRDLVQSADHFLRKLGHRLHFQSSHDSFITALDGPKMSKLLLGLISNGLKHLPNGGSLHLNLTGSEEGAVLSLRDTGEGIPPAEMAHVFARYKRERSATDTRAGVGLGMAVAQEIASLHGGTLLVTGRAGKGTTVLLRLPLRRMETDGALQENPLPYGEGDGGMYLILTELADVLGDEAFGGRYRD